MDNKKMFTEIDRISKLYYTGVEQQHFMMDIYESLKSQLESEVGEICDICNHPFHFRPETDDEIAERKFNEWSEWFFDPATKQKDLMFFPLWLKNGGHSG